MRRVSEHLRKNLVDDGDTVLTDATVWEVTVFDVAGSIFTDSTGLSGSA